MAAADADAKYPGVLFSFTFFWETVASAPPPPRRHKNKPAAVAQFSLSDGRRAGVVLLLGSETHSHEFPSKSDTLKRDIRNRVQLFVPAYVANGRPFLSSSFSSISVRGRRRGDEWFFSAKERKKKNRAPQKNEKSREMCVCCVRFSC